VSVTGVYSAGGTLSPSRSWAASLATFRAACGDGHVDTGEQCDLGAQNGQSGSCCTATCTFVTAGTTCRNSTGACDPAETCTGSSATCPADVLSPAGTLCHTAVNDCDLDHTCTGTSTTCPTTVKPAGTACTDDGNVCTTDTCNGTVGNPLCQHLAGNAG